MKGVMIQGTASDVGKSLIVTALCRLFSDEGFKVAPFKSQNMSNHIYLTAEGLEIGLAQGIQAEAARTKATVWMSPILLKPRTDQVSEVILLGKPIDSLSGKGYRESFYEKGLEVIGKAIEQLKKEYELLILEGAGSPVEMNLKDRELVNMKVAQMADVPVILVADIDRGGIFASLVGTLELLTPEERRRVKGIIINKFRGDIELFKDGVRWIEDKTGIPVVGVLPYIHNHMIDPEDSFSIDELGRESSASAYQAYKDTVEAPGGGHRFTKEADSIKPGSNCTKAHLIDSRYDKLATEMGAHLDWAEIKRIIWDGEILSS